MTPKNKTTDLLPIGTLVRYFYEDFNSTDCGTLNEIISRVSEHKLAYAFSEKDRPEYLEMREPLRVRTVGRRHFIDLSAQGKPFRTKEEVVSEMDALFVLPEGFELT